MSSDYYQRFDLAYSRFFVRKRVGKCFKVISRFRTYDQALEHLTFMTDLFPGVHFDIKYVSLPYLDKKSSL